MCFCEKLAHADVRITICVHLRSLASVSRIFLYSCLVVVPTNEIYDFQITDSCDINAPRWFYGTVCGSTNSMPGTQPLKIYSKSHTCISITCNREKLGSSLFFDLSKFVLVCENDAEI